MIANIGSMRVSEKSPENWEFTFGESQNTGTNFRFAVNRIFLFKGLVELMSLENNTALYSSEGNNRKCKLEL